MHFIKNMFIFSLLTLSTYGLCAQMPALSRDNILCIEKASSALALASIKCAFCFDHSGFLYSAYILSAINIMTNASLYTSHKKDKKTLIKMTPATGIVLGGILNIFQHQLNECFGRNGFYAGQTLFDMSYYAMGVKELSDIYELTFQK